MFLLKKAVRLSLCFIAGAGFLSFVTGCGDEPDMPEPAEDVEIIEEEAEPENGGLLPENGDDERPELDIDEIPID